jgi:hypothetical protein
MKLTELIRICQEALIAAGDVDAVVYSTEDIHEPEVVVEEVMVGKGKELVIR